MTKPDKTKIMSNLRNIINWKTSIQFRITSIVGCSKSFEERKKALTELFQKENIDYEEQRLLIASIKGVEESKLF